MGEKSHRFAEGLGYQNAVKGVRVYRRQGLYERRMFGTDGLEAIACFPEIGQGIGPGNG